jgi:hypothetical protein
VFPLSLIRPSLHRPATRRSHALIDVGSRREWRRAGPLPFDFAQGNPEPVEGLEQAGSAKPQNRAERGVRAGLPRKGPEYAE